MKELTRILFLILLTKDRIDNKAKDTYLQSVDMFILFGQLCLAKT